MSKLLKNASFGDRFMTRGNEVAMYAGYKECIKCHVLFFNNTAYGYYSDDGIYQNEKAKNRIGDYHEKCKKYDIISKIN